VQYYSLLFICILLTLAGCGLPNISSQSSCLKHPKNDYLFITEGQFKTVVNNDTIVSTELKYQCVYSTLYIPKGMYDRFGKWTEVIRMEKQRPILLWRNVKLFKFDTTLYNVATYPEENHTESYSAVLVFDDKNQDQLGAASDKREDLSIYFSTLIRSNNENKQDFYPAFWKEIDLKKYHKIYGD
jgi:hypothetical protein